MKYARGEEGNFQIKYSLWDKFLEWFWLKVDKCPSCKAGIGPHRNCILR